MIGQRLLLTIIMGIHHCHHPLMETSVIHILLLLLLRALLIHKVRRKLIHPVVYAIHHRIAARLPPLVAAAAIVTIRIEWHRRRRRVHCVCCEKKHCRAFLCLRLFLGSLLRAP